MIQELIATHATAPATLAAPVDTPRGPFDLDGLLHPLTVETFIGEYFEKRFLHLERGEPGYFRPLVGRAEVDRLIATSEHQPDFTLALIQDGAIAHRVGNGVQRFGPGEALRLQRLDPATVYRHHAQGATIRLCQMERLTEPLWLLASELERQIQAEVKMNLYLTPKNSQAFHPHVDLHDVLILQLEGRKRWQVYNPPTELPVERVVHAHRQLHSRPFPRQHHWPGRPLPGEEATEILLEPGDVLYLPRGYPHSASTDDGSSMHLTVGFTALTLHELVVHAVTSRLGHERLLRTGLRPGFVANAEAARQVLERGPELAETIERALSPELLAEAARDLAQRFIYSRRITSNGQLRDIEEIDDLDLDTELRVRPGTTARVESRPDGFYLLFSSRVLPLPPRVADMVHFMLRQRSFRVREILSRLGDKSRLILCRKLLIEGFLARQRP